MINEKAVEMVRYLADYAGEKGVDDEGVKRELIGILADLTEMTELTVNEALKELVVDRLLMERTK